MTVDNAISHHCVEGAASAQRGISSPSGSRVGYTNVGHSKTNCTSRTFEVNDSTIENVANFVGIVCGRITTAVIK